MPLHYIHFEIAQFNNLNTRTTRFWSVPLHIEPAPGLSKSETRNVFTSHFENMSMLLRRVIGCFILLACAHLLRKRYDLEQKYSVICE